MLSGVLNIEDVDELSIRIMYDFLLLLWFMSLYLICKILNLALFIY